MLQDFWQPAAWQYQAASAFLDQELHLHPHRKVYDDLVLNQWWACAGGKTDKAGHFGTLGYFGKYEITVRAPDKMQTVLATLATSDIELTVRLK